MRFGLTDSEYDLLRCLVIEPLAKRGARVWIFGSRARGDHKKFSDIDILFEISDRAVLPAGFLSRIQEEVEESRLPYKVDLVEMRQLAESYREGILKDRREIQ